MVIVLPTVVTIFIEVEVIKIGNFISKYRIKIINFTLSVLSYIY